MAENNLLVISNNFPNKNDTFTGNIFVKEQIKFLSRYFDNIYVISPVALGMEYLRKTKHLDYRSDNVRVFFPKYINNFLFWYYLRSYWVKIETRTIVALIEKEHLRFNLIHAHMTWPSGAVAIELKRRYNAPVVITEHTSKTFQTAIVDNDVLWKNTLNSADAIIRVKKGDSAFFEKIHVPATKIHPIPNGFDAGIFYPMPLSECKKTLGLPENKKILLYVGDMYHPLKGHTFFIEAIGQIIKKRQDILGIVVGRGKLERRMHDLIETLQLNQYIRLVGSKPHAEIPLWMNACDLFVLPSLKESFGIVQIEALACGKPVVATRNGGSEEIIISEEYGLLAEPADAGDLAEKILLALDREWDKKKITGYAERFTWKTIASEIMGVYQGIGVQGSDSGM